jgi:hypothetical protein
MIFLPRENKKHETNIKFLIFFIEIFFCQYFLLNLIDPKRIIYCGSILDLFRGSILDLF